MAHHRVIVLTLLVHSLTSGAWAASNAPTAARAAHQEASNLGEAQITGPLEQVRRRRSLSRPEVYFQLLEDERFLTRRLPDLIAQAHHDKALERALLKTLIGASLRSAVEASSPNELGVGTASAPLVDPDTGSLVEGAQLPVSADLLLPAGREDGNVDLDSVYMSKQSDVDKREAYLKPCFFNAVSCPRNPYRKHNSG